VAILPYLNALSDDFTFDDITVIRDNPAVQIYPARQLFGYVHQPGSWYRPLTMLTYAANASISHAPFGYHAVNIFLHALVAVAVFFLALRIFDSRVAAVAAALLFAAHPIHTEAVTSIVGRAELLATLGVLAALLAFARSRECGGRHRVAWSALSVVAFAAALLSKESAFTGLGLLAALDWWVVRRASLRQRLTALMPYAAVGIVYLLLRLAVVGALGLPEVPLPLDNPLAHVDLWSRLRTAVIVLWDYVGLLALPLHLSADYSFDQVPVAHTWSDPRFLIAAALLAGLAGVLLATARRAPVLALAVLFTVVPLALTANLFFPIGTIKAERLLYLPSVGWVFACGWLAARATTQRSTGWVVALALLAAVYGGRTWLRNRDWRDNSTLFAVTLIDAPDSAKAHFNAGVGLETAGRGDEAILQYGRALAIYPRCAEAALGIGNVYENKGSDGLALYWYEHALQQEPALAKAHLQIGLIRGRRGELDASEAAILTGLAIEPNNPALLVQFSAILLAEGDRWQAGAVLERVRHLDTLDPEEHAVVAQTRHDIEVALR
jgi:protein O-mannosyl-transferase